MTQTQTQHASIHPAWRDSCDLCALALRNVRLRPLLWAPGAPLPAPARVEEPWGPEAPERGPCVHLGRRVRLEGGAVKRKLCRVG
jgi:hypothetical protein